MNQFAMIREATLDDLDVLARIIREKIDIRVGTIVLVEDVLGAEKLVRLIVALIKLINARDAGRRNRSSGKTLI
jgi:tRNA-binding EMAP/Myf-like protein